ncbi:hypothetical protein CCACVL1_11234 [Corchorus capsularis]|uniref:Uncharacterized protein n=1 Tax=Corchorus capsularis TaxID=210143 RepID=A0A1R3IME9_COCAP|nr:hypothetical protein CCACVL1_11234 [Corchorus capsularis]
MALAPQALLPCQVKLGLKSGQWLFKSTWATFYKNFINIMGSSKGNG